MYLHCGSNSQQNNHPEKWLRWWSAQSGSNAWSLVGHNGTTGIALFWSSDLSSKQEDICLRAVFWMCFEAAKSVRWMFQSLISAWVQANEVDRGESKVAVRQWKQASVLSNLPEHRTLSLSLCVALRLSLRLSFCECSSIYQINYCWWEFFLTGSEVSRH